MEELLTICNYNSKSEKIISPNTYYNKDWKGILKASNYLNPEEKQQCTRLLEKYKFLF